MHLFIIHQFPDLDAFTPIIYKLDHKLKGIVKILSVFPVHDFREYELVKFLLKQKIQYLRSLNLNLSVEDPMSEIVEALFKKLDNA